MEDVDSEGKEDDRDKSACESTLQEEQNRIATSRTPDSRITLIAEKCVHHLACLVCVD